MFGSQTTPHGLARSQPQLGKHPGRQRKTDLVQKLGKHRCTSNKTNNSNSLILPTTTSKWSVDTAATAVPLQQQLQAEEFDAASDGGTAEGHAEGFCRVLDLPEAEQLASLADTLGEKTYGSSAPTWAKSPPTTCHTARSPVWPTLLG
jgi:hypothetical protein